jgi:branched-chain amino acid transport system ATP-binding protein
MSVLLEVEGLSSAYGRIRALEDVSLRVDEGALVALIGANGAGKTTLLRTLSGVHPAAAGRIRFSGIDITRAAPQARVRAGMAQVPEGRQVFGPLSVEDNLRLGGYLRSRGESDAQLEHVYALFPALQAKRRELAGTLSGGQQQMVAIGRALMSRPKMLLLDEPSMGLAPKLVDEVFDTIERLRGEGVSVLLVEQNAAVALAIADRGYVLETGRIVLEGVGHDLMTNPEVREAYLGM